MKKCPKCKTEKPYEEFSKSKSRKDGHAVHCKTCANGMNKAAYRKKPEHYRKKRLATVNRHLKRFLEWKSEQKCLLCSEDAVVCLDFHHRDPSQKDFVISEMLRQRGWDSLMTEIKKCVILCANCHRKVHAGWLTLP